MGFPADTFQEATEIAIEASNQLRGVINGDANAEVTVEDGSKIPSVRKAMVDSLYFKPPVAWAQGEYEDTYNQLREFVDGDVRTWWFAKGATVSTPVLMTTNPAIDVNWTLWSAVTLNAATYETQKRLAAEAGLNMVGSFLLGATVTTADDVVFYETDGKYYGWGGTLPKVVSAGSTPSTAGGVGVGSWVDRSDVNLRDELEPRISDNEAKVFEALRRSYAEAGYNLVAGSFEAGGTLVNANDVLLQERTGKAFSGPSGTVAAGTNPASGGFVDKSGGLLRHELATSANGGSVQDFIDNLAATDSETPVGGETAGDIANNMIAPVLRGKSLTPPIMTGLIPSRKSALLKISDQQYRSYLHLGGRTWQVSDFANSGLDAAGNTTPFGWNQTIIQDFAGSIIWGDAGVTSGAGTWTDLSTSDPNPYLGHRAAQATAVGAYVEISLQVDSGTADITLNFSGRNNGNIIDVTIDGSTALVNEADTVDTYTPIDLTHRQTKLVASGLPARVSPYLVRFTLSAAKNPSSLTGDRFIFAGLTIDGDSFGNPRSPNVRPKAWMPNTAYARYQEAVGGGGRIYVCTVAGTTGTTIPSHTSGSATDGTVTWLLIARSAFITNTNRTDTLQAAGSHLEYAYEFRPTPSDLYQDVGGNLHGNEYLTSALTVSVDGLVKTLQNGSYAVGYQIVINQKIRAYYGIVTSAPADICDTSLTHSIGGGKIVVSHESKMLSDGNFGFHYPAMWPVVYFNGVTAKLVCSQMELAQTGRVDLIDYAGQLNPFVGATTDLQMRAIGDIYRPIGYGGVPSTGDGEYHCIMSLTVSNYGVGDYEYGSRLASIAPNLSGAVAPSGFSSWVGKMYFARSNTDKPEPVTIGQIIRADNEYKVSLFRK